MTLDDLVSQLRAAYGEALRAVVLYGSAAAGDHAAPGPTTTCWW
jgi:predicted nucleotidyltransferase